MKFNFFSKHFQKKKEVITYQNFMKIRQEGAVGFPCEWTDRQL